MVDDAEYEEEEILVYMDFTSKIDDDLISMDKEFKIIGLESETPILQLSSQVFQGEWKDALGTQVIFEHDECPPKSDSLFCETPTTYMKYSCKTNKILSMSRIFVKPKSDLSQKVSSTANDSSGEAESTNCV